jgi:RNA polymerase sigma factor (TIGR02999 family)
MSSLDITGLLAAWSNGDKDALDALMPVVYPELRRIARRHLGRRPTGHTLESGALANEAYLKLIRAQGLHCDNRVHFLALCSQMIRRILVDHARARAYAKRGGDAVRVPLDSVAAAAPAASVGMLALNEALDSLAEVDPRKSRVAELRYFGGLSLAETAEVLGFRPRPPSAIGKWPKRGCCANWAKGNTVCSDPLSPGCAETMKPVVNRSREVKHFLR